jgi:hypothetical protein
VVLAHVQPFALHLDPFAVDLLEGARDRDELFAGHGLVPLETIEDGVVLGGRGEPVGFVRGRSFGEDAASPRSLAIWARPSTTRLAGFESVPSAIRPSLTASACLQASR